MKVNASVKADRSKGDILVRRRGRLYVINKKDPNRKQRQKGPARKKQYKESYGEEVIRRKAKTPRTLG